VDVFCIFHIEAARRLPLLPQDHVCSRLHGHSFRVEVHISGPVQEATGWVVDFGDVERAFAPIRGQLDHRYLNDIEGLENPTSENLARWIWRRLAPDLPGLARVTVQETANAGCIYRGD
jgi:6-pyruvoyltetrahydropterin/6-carboxytetrahydropterin synthase